MKRVALGLCVPALVLALVPAACGGDDDTSAPADSDAQSATLVLNWTPNAHHLGVYAAEEMGWYDDAGIDLTIVEPTQGGVEQAIGSGAAEFGISAAEFVLPARAEGIPVVSIATILPVNDSALMALGDSGIAEPADLAGTTYGGYGGALETELINRLAECGGVDPGEISHVEVGNVDYLAGLDADRFDFAWVFSGWDALRATEVEERDISLVKFEDYTDCIPNWYTPLFIAGEDLIADDPDLVRTFLDVTARGYRLVIADPQQAADLMLEAVPETDETLMRAAADYHATRYTAAGMPWGTQDTETWTEFEQFLVDAGILEAPVGVDDTFTNDFLAQ
ncbi:MAG: ABC transporter substrate-binding protein [Actinomycetota bacterium]|nr:ABC transporter substrate-binding protein [Actinomycetota bacterium]